MVRWVEAVAVRVARACEAVAAEGRVRRAGAVMVVRVYEAPWWEGCSFGAGGGGRGRSWGIAYRQ